MTVKRFSKRHKPIRTGSMGEETAATKFWKLEKWLVKGLSRAKKAEFEAGSGENRDPI